MSFYLELAENKNKKMLQRSSWSHKCLICFIQITDMIQIGIIHSKLAHAAPSSKF